MAHVLDNVKADFLEYMHNNTDKNIEDWIALNKGLPKYKMPDKKTLKRWLNGRRK